MGESESSIHPYDLHVGRYGPQLAQGLIRSAGITDRAQAKRPGKRRSPPKMKKTRVRRPSPIAGARYVSRYHPRIVERARLAA